MPKTTSLVVFVLAILLIVFSIRSASPPSVREGVIPDSAFSVQRAYAHLLQISHAPHSTGTPENARVREYIVSACKALGFDVQVQNSVATSNYGEFVRAANIYNVIAIKKGAHNSKAVMLMAHYDSQANTPGAGDDGAGVAAMLETARALQKINPLQNDLILLFTDGEEIGLLGANAFVKESPLLKEIGIVINFEGRGNSGPSNMFEVNPQNGWAINEYAKSAAHPFANSLGYEIYKKLPNGTDYTLFKDAGITGLNNAYINGFVNYHSPNDKPENLDLRSLQHHGDNMLSLARHFGNLNIVNTKAPDISYFNVIGSWFIHYPASWNLFFVILTDLLFVWYLFAAFKSRQVTIGGFVISTILFPIVLTIVYFVARFMLKKILGWYPMYSHFDEHNSYNSGWYFLMMAALSATIFSFVYYLVSRKLKMDSLLSGALLLVVILMDGMQYAVPSASYLLFIPLLFILAFRVVLMPEKNKTDNRVTRTGLLNLISVIPAIWLIAPTIYFTFIAFALGNNMPFVAIASSLLTGLLLPVLYPVFRQYKLLVPSCIFLCFAGAILGGHLSAGYSKVNPLQTSVVYSLDADSSKAKWLSDFSSVDKWSGQFFKKGIVGRSKENTSKLMSEAPVLSLPAPSASILKDTVNGDKRELSVHFSPGADNVTCINVTLNQSDVSTLVINKEELKAMHDNKPSGFRGIRYYGVNKNGFDLIFKMDADKKLNILVDAESIGLPAIDGFTTYSEEVIPGTDYYSNTVQVKKHFVF